MLEVIEVRPCTDGRPTLLPFVDIAGQGPSHCDRDKS